MHKRMYMLAYVRVHMCVCVCVYVCMRVTAEFVETSRGQPSSHLNHSNSNISLLGLREKNIFKKFPFLIFFHYSGQ